MSTNTINVPMVDTLGQYSKIKDEINAGLQEVLESGMYINGPIVHQFKQNLANYLGVKHVIPCANGTDALQVALMAMDCQPGDEVITPSFTFVATVEVIALLGLKPVFVDVLPDTFNMDPAKIEDAITEKTKVILPVHLYGQSADMAPIMDIAKKHGLKVLEDNAQAIGGTYTFPDGTTAKTGTIGDMGTTSFYPSKNLGAFGDAGAIFTNDEELGKKAQIICNHGSSKRYHHTSIGVNSRLDSFQAVVLDVKLKHLDEYNDARRQAANAYNTAFSGLEGVITPHIAPNTSHVFHQYTLKLTEGRAKRDRLKELLQDRGIPSMIYYPIPIHKQEAYLPYNYQSMDLTNTDELTNQVLSLPMHSELDQAKIDYIASHFIECYQQ